MNTWTNKNCGKTRKLHEFDERLLEDAAASIEDSLDELVCTNDVTEALRLLSRIKSIAADIGEQLEKTSVFD